MTKLEKPLIGAEYIRQFAKNLTTKPGVYRMLGEDDKVLYVGKAKNLKNRVTSYATRGVMQNRTLRMVSQTLKMVVITTGSEAEALLLEASLIKQLSPMFNILLKDDKSFPFIELTNHEFPQIRKHRGKQKRGNTYFGPFATVSAMNHTLALLQKAFLLRPCNDTIYKNRSRPCLQYQIKRCSAPCVDRIARGEYDALIEQAKDFLAGKSTEVQQRLAKQMEKLSEEMDYEQAAACRDRIRALTQVQQEQSLGVTNIGDADVIGVYREGGRACVQMFFFRGGQAYGNRALFPARAAEADEKALIAATIGHFYQRYPAPKQLLLSHKPDDMDVIAEALALSSGHAISVSVPQRGDKKQLMEQVIANAKNALALHTAEKMQASASLEGVQKLFALAEAPKRIEVYDNSHISGTNAVGAMVVATPDGFEKKSYRKFSFTDDVINGGDDTAMMREVMMRRLSRLQKEDPDRTSANVPDLLLIDGGKGQLSVVNEVMEELGIHDICYVAISKGPDRNAGREQFHLPEKTPFQLPPDDPTLYYLQRLRDEAHRFAISSHRAKRSSQIRQSTLDEVPGIGGTRKKALLHHFGSAKAVKEATIDDLTKVEGISRKTAQIVHGYFRD